MKSKLTEPLFSESAFLCEGPDPWLMLRTADRFLPFWIQGVLICILLLLSGLFAGLTLGILSLDTTSLKVSISSPTLSLIRVNN
jgi:hypothetical protein